MIIKPFRYNYFFLFKVDFETRKVRKIKRNSEYFLQLFKFFMSLKVFLIKKIKPVY